MRFCGREEQLDALVSLWREVRSGETGPRTVVLLAESGLGKTRLAQQLYASIVALEQGGAGYWPAELGIDGSNLLVNPAPADCDSSAGVPFLWWGVRLADQDERNQVATGALAAHVDSYLVPHLEPFHREQRRRQRGAQLAKVGGAVAADIVGDLVPVLGLIKKAAELGAELKGIHDQWRQDSRQLDAATLLEQRRDSLVDQLLADLGKLFEGPYGRTVPAAILIDDAQFSAADPGVTAFVKALLHAMTEGGWPVLLVLTHWEREYAEGVEGQDGQGPHADRAAGTSTTEVAGSPVAAAVHEHSLAHPEAVQVLRLTPIVGLEPLVEERLPGLSSDQVQALIARAGGNPQFLDEILKVALDPRNRPMFEGRNAQNPMTDAGLNALLAKSVRLHDVVAERFAGSPEPVQKAVALAGLQGAEFLGALVGHTALYLGDLTGGQAEVDEALHVADRKHGFVSHLGIGHGAFMQRIYQEVASEFLHAFYDEEEALTALRTAVAEVLLGERSLELLPDAQVGLWKLGTALFEEAEDVEQRRLSAHCLHMLADVLRDTGELQVAHALAKRQAALLATLPDDRLDGELAWLRSVNDTLAAVGDLEAQRPLLARLVRLTGETYEDDVNAWSAAMYAHTLMDVAEFYEMTEQPDERAGALAAAVEVMSIDAPPQDEGLLEASLRLHRLYGDWFVEHGQLDQAEEVQRQALSVAHHLAAEQDGPRRRFDLASMQRSVGRTALMRGDVRSARMDLETAAGNLRELLATEPSVTLEIQLASTLDDLADAFTKEGRLADAQTLLEESLSMMRRHLSMAPTALRTLFNLADSLVRVGEARYLVDDQEGSWQAHSEAVGIRRELAERSGTLAARSDLGLALARAGEVAGARGDMAAGLSHAAEAVELLLAVWQQDQSLKAAWRTLFVIRVQLLFELMQGDLPAAEALLRSADDVAATISQEALPHVAAVLSRIEGLRASALEASGDAVGAAAALATARRLTTLEVGAAGADEGAGQASDGGHGPN